MAPKARQHPTSLKSDKLPAVLKTPPLAGFLFGWGRYKCQGGGLVKRTNYKQEKRQKELEKQKKKDAKKERKLRRENAPATDQQHIDDAEIV
ncbi:hypothetical protein [Desulfobulbus propionicus]